MDSVGVFCVILFNGTFIRSFCVGNIFASVNVYFCSCSFGNFFWEEVLFLCTLLEGFLSHVKIKLAKANLGLYDRGIKSEA